MSGLDWGRYYIIFLFCLLFFILIMYIHRRPHKTFLHAAHELRIAGKLFKRKQFISLTIDRCRLNGLYRTSSVRFGRIKRNHRQGMDNP